MNRLARIIEDMPLADLKLLQKDLDAGNLDRLIKLRLETLEKRKQCPTCGRELVPSEQKFALEFGPRDLRQRAFFDEYDCMQYFLQKLEIESKRQEGGNERNDGRKYGKDDVGGSGAGSQMGGRSGHLSPSSSSHESMEDDL